MKATQEAVQTPAAAGARRNEKVGQVVSTKMQKTIVVEVEMRKAHPKYNHFRTRHRRRKSPRTIPPAPMGSASSSSLIPTPPNCTGCSEPWVSRLSQDTA
jgi:hypothetical protein